MSMIVFNFKNYLSVDDSLKFAYRLRRAKTEHEIVIAPSVLSLNIISVTVGKKVNVCAQNIDYSDGYGAGTGLVMADDLKKIGCKYALIGHSETRNRDAPAIGDSNELIAKKIRIAIKKGIIPILCFGETRGERAAGRTKTIIGKQIRYAMSEINYSDAAKIIFAYEPLWAINGSRDSEACSVEEAAEMAEYARGIMGEDSKNKFLYGGSVNHDNISKYLSSSKLDGVLIGKAGTDRLKLNKLLAKIGKQQK